MSKKQSVACTSATAKPSRKAKAIPTHTSTEAPQPALKPYKATAQGMQAKAALISLLQSLPDEDYAEALDALQGRWLNGMKSGLENGFNAGWSQGCDQLQEERCRPEYKVELPPDYAAPAWPGVMRETGTLDFVTCVLSLQVSRRGGGGKDCGNVIHAQWAALDRAFTIARNTGEEQGRKFGLSVRHGRAAAPVLPH